MIRVLLCDDMPEIREFLVAWLSMEPDMNVVGEAADGNAALDAVDKLRPDIVLMDLQMPGMDGVEATRLISQLYPRTAVIILTSRNSQSLVVDCLHSGARGYVSKSADPSLYIEAIRCVYAGEPYIEPALVSPPIAALLHTHHM